MRVGMTQIRIRAARRDLLHDVSLRGIAPAAKGAAQIFAAMPSVFRHILARRPQ